MGQAFDQGTELQKLGGIFFQGSVTIGIRNYTVQALPFCFRQPLNRLDGFRSQASGGIVDDSAQAQIIGSIVDDAEIGQHILDFRPVKEPGAANDLIRNAIALQRIFHGIGLRVCPVENCIVLKIFTVGPGQDLPCYKVPFGGFVIGFVDQDRTASLPCGPELFALPAHIVRNHGVGGIQNGLSRPVVLLQTDDPGPGVLLLKRQDILDGSATETVDTLVIVTHHADIAPLPGQQCRQ